MSIYLLLALIFVAVVSYTLLAMVLFGKKSDPAAQRVKKVLKSPAYNAEGQNMSSSADSEEEEKESLFHRLVSLFGMFSRKSKPKFSQLKLTLTQAGYYSHNSVRVFISLRIWIAMVMFAIAMVPVLLAGNLMPPVLLFAILLTFPMMGYSLPGIVLNAKVRRRKNEIAYGLPDALDFLVVCVEAGLGLNAALIRVGSELHLKSRALGEELLLVNQEMRAGLSREQALRNLTQRNPIEDLRVLVGSLILGDKLGTSVSSTLRAQADSMRTRLRQRAEETAAQASIKMLFPMVFLILPALFIVIMGPGVIMTLQSMAR
jgi:tight adherence protein C